MQSGTPAPDCGVYNEGELTVLDDSEAAQLLPDWPGVIAADAVALMTTAFGDMFFFDPSEGVKFLEAQRASTEFIDKEVAWVLSEFLGLPSILSDVLRRDRFQEVRRIKGPLSYGQTYILEPWQCIGGVDSAQNYGVGDCRVYLSLVSQTVDPDWRP
jgi:hypothetical protein